MGGAVTRFGYPVSLSHDFQIEVGSDGVTINGRSKSESGHAMFADVAGIFIWDSGGSLNERALALSLQDGRTVAFRVPLKRPHAGTEGAPTWDHETAMKEFHAAASSVLRQLILARPELQLVERSPPPSVRRMLRVFGACGLAALLALLLLFRPINLASNLTLIPYLGWAVVAALYVWSNWIQKWKKIPISKLAESLATQSAKLPG
jgi:hypothetical protein